MDIEYTEEMSLKTHTCCFTENNKCNLEPYKYYFW